MHMYMVLGEVFISQSSNPTKIGKRENNAMQSERMMTMITKQTEENFPSFHDGLLVDFPFTTFALHIYYI